MSTITLDERASARTPAPTSGAAPAPAILPIREETARMLAVVGLVAIAVIHILDAAGTYTSTRYIFWLYMAVIIGAIPGTLLLAHWSSRRAWIAPALLAAGPLLGYLLSRTIGLPGDGDDVGNWLDTLGMASLFVETGVLSLSLLRLGTADRLLARLERVGR